MGLLDWALDHGAGLIVSGGALVFAWLGWRRGRQLVSGRILPLEELRKGHRELRGMQLVLTAEIRARRNSIWLAGTYLEVGNERVWGRDQSDNWKKERVAEGQRVLRSWWLTDIRHLPANKRWDIGWVDAEDRSHRLATVSNADVQRLTTGKTQAEREGTP